jgi:hypothetical protein
MAHQPHAELEKEAPGSRKENTSLQKEGCFLEVTVEDLEPEAIGECIALSETQRALLKDIEDKKAETISTLARDNVELTWELQDLKFQLEDQCKMWQGKF